jgi:hypothetical protein
MTSIVIPLAGHGHGSRWNDTELRYCLRSIEKHLSGHGDIFLIGHRPDWCINVHHIPAVDGEMVYERDRNIFNKIMLAINDERVTENFLFMNDDHWLLKDYQADRFPIYCHGDLAEYVVREDLYGNTVKNTALHVDALSPYFDVHCPIVYNKTIFPQLQRYDWNKKYGYCIKTLYVNQLAPPFITTEHPDIKINEPISSNKIRMLIDGKHWFSAGHKAAQGGLGKTLQDLYPVKSRYEK